MTEQTPTETVETPEAEQVREKRQKVGKWIAVGIFAVGIGLLIDDQIKRIRRREENDLPEEEMPQV